MKFSVIIPVYNKANTIRESGESILAQTEKDYEIIIVNDGSSDDLASALAPFPEICVIHQENGGVSVARNTGIDAAKGDYICFLDADDLWLPNHLEEFSALIEQYPHTRMYVTSHKETRPDGSEYHSSEKLRDLPQRFLADNLFEILNNRTYSLINTNCICIQRAWLLEMGIYFEPGEKIGEDTDVWYRVALHTPVGMTKAETTVYRRENSTATRAGSGSFTWKFAKRWPELQLQDVDAARKDECAKLVDRYKLTCCRSYVLRKDRKAAKSLLKEVTHYDKRYHLTKMLVYMPYFLSGRLITHK